MKAFRNVGGNVIEIDVDVGIDGNPILPPDTTIDPKPADIAGQYTTVVGNAWVHIPIPQQVISFEYKKQQALEKLAAYKKWYLDQPVPYSGAVFDSNEVSRNRLIQALVINTATGYLPPGWVTADNNSFPIPDLAALKNLIAAIQTAFATKFYEMETIRSQVVATTTEADLNLITIPHIPTMF